MTQNGVINYTRMQYNAVQLNSITVSGLRNFFVTSALGNSSLVDVCAKARRLRSCAGLGSLGFRVSAGFEREPFGLRNIGVRIVRQLTTSPHNLYTVAEVR